MALTQQTVVDKIEILEDETIQIRHARRVFDSDELIAERYHRMVYVPITPLADVQPLRVRRIAQLLWTPEVIQAYKDKIAATRITP